MMDKKEMNLAIIDIIRTHYSNALNIYIRANANHAAECAGFHSFASDSKKNENNIDWEPQSRNPFNIEKKEAELKEAEEYYKKMNDLFYHTIKTFIVEN